MNSGSINSDNMTSRGLSVLSVVLYISLYPDTELFDCRIIYLKYNVMYMNISLEIEGSLDYFGWDRASRKAFIFQKQL